MRKYFIILAIPIAGLFLSSKLILPVMDLATSVFRNSQMSDGFGGLMIIPIVSALGWILPVTINLILVLLFSHWVLRGLPRTQKVAALLFVILFPIAYGAISISGFRSTNLNAALSERESTDLRKQLHREGFDPNAIIPETGTPLLVNILCERIQHLAAVPEILGLPDIDVNILDGRPLECAIKKHETEIVRRLIDRPDIQIKFDHFLAAISNSADDVASKWIAEKKFDLNSKVPNVVGFPPLLAYAAVNGSDAVFSQLLGIPEVDVNATDESGLNALMMALNEGRKGAAIRLLKDPRVDVKHVDAKGRDVWAFVDPDRADTDLVSAIEERYTKPIHGISDAIRPVDLSRCPHDWYGQNFESLSNERGSYVCHFSGSISRLQCEKDGGRIRVLGKQSLCERYLSETRSFLLRVSLK